MIANYGYRVGNTGANARMQKLRESFKAERLNLALGGFGLATALWTAAFSMQPALLPLTAVPVLFTSRYRDRRLAAVAIAATAISASVFARLPNLEIGVWHTVLFAAALAGLYLLAEKNVVRASKVDPVARFLEESTLANRKGVEIILECDGLSGVGSVYGAAARDHVVELLRGSIRRESPANATTDQSAPGEFHLFLPNASFKAATQIAERIRSAFERSAFDAGYGSSLQLNSGPMSKS